MSSVEGSEKIKISKTSRFHCQCTLLTYVFVLTKFWGRLCLIYQSKYALPNGIYSLNNNWHSIQQKMRFQYDKKQGILSVVCCSVRINASKTKENEVKKKMFCLLTARAWSVARYKTAKLSRSAARVNPQIWMREIQLSHQNVPVCWIYNDNSCMASFTRKNKVVNNLMRIFGKPFLKTVFLGTNPKFK